MAKRRVGSIKAELIKKSKESMISAVQCFNNPGATFRSESFIVLTIIAWTYLLHAYYKEIGVDFRILDSQESRRKYKRTRHGAIMYWGLEDCIRSSHSPLDVNTKNNLLFLIGLRHEVEHEMSLRLDNVLSARYQACALNYCHYIKGLFGESQAIESRLAFSIQFTQLLKEQILSNDDHPELSTSLKSYLAEFDDNLSDEEFNSERYAYRMIFFRKTKNNRGGADHVIEFIDPDSEMAKELESTYLSIKEVERAKYLPMQIVAMMNAEGFPKFNRSHFIDLWQQECAKEPAKGYGTLVVKQWYWYETWVDFVRRHCLTNKSKYI